MAALVLCHPKLLLMTDYDGTLVPLEDRPELALPGAGLLRTLRRLAGKRRITLAVVSGRDVDDLKSMLPVEGIYLAGCHGAEFAYPGGGRYAAVDAEKLAPALDLLAGEAARCVANCQGFLLERKKTVFALHYRLADPVTALRVVSDFAAAARPLAARYGMELKAGKKVIEVRPRAVHKGEAVRHLMNLNPGCYPVYLGDDSSDEDAFAVLRESGTGVLVSEHKRITSASHRLKDPQEVLRFLQILSARS
ncbi:MAG: trehalose-phosphatase [Pelotomaculum sp.]|nr:trehalose-phosphatase [Pelotomaculum sp.]